MNTEQHQKKVGFWSVGFVVLILVLAVLIAGCWYYLRGRKTNRETPQQQSQLEGKAPKQPKREAGHAGPSLVSGRIPEKGF
jgi:membrane protein implicated in regulation of membrane protease activity